MEVPQQTINELKAEGYSDQDIATAINRIKNRGGELSQAIMPVTPSAYSPAPTPSQFQFNQQENLIKWQLDLNDILERAEHILRQDVVEIKEGNTKWKSNPDKENVIFNEYAVQEIMRILSMYINRNTILSDYEPEEINDKVFDFGKELNDLIFMKYEDFGLTNLKRRKNYPMLVRQLIDIVHSAYKRAQFGGERSSLRTARSIAQQETIMPQGINIQTGQPSKERGILNPMRLVGGKYK